MTLVNRLSRMLGGHAVEQDPGRRHTHENVMMSDSMRAQPDKEAYALFERLMMIRNARLSPRQQEWDASDERFAALVAECAQHLGKLMQEINEIGKAAR